MAQFDKDSLADEKFFQAVRLLLGIADGDIMDDDSILSEIYFLVALSMLEDMLPCLYDEEFTPGQLAKIRLAFIYLIASLIAPTLAGVVEYEVKTIDVTWKKKPVNYNELSDMLLAKANDMLADFECYAGGLETILFSVAPSKRAVKEAQCGWCEDGN